MFKCALSVPAVFWDLFHKKDAAVHLWWLVNDTFTYINITIRESFSQKEKCSNLRWTQSHLFFFNTLIGLFPGVVMWASQFCQVHICKIIQLFPGSASLLFLYWIRNGSEKMHIYCPVSKQKAATLNQEIVVLHAWPDCSIEQTCLS